MELPHFTVREMVDLLDAYFEAGDRDAGDLWDILGAIRGADSEKFKCRRWVTNPIRVRCFPRTANAKPGVDSTFFTTMFLELNLDKARKDGGKHFMIHAKAARDAMRRAGL